MRQILVLTDINEITKSKQAKKTMEFMWKTMVKNV